METIREVFEHVANHLLKQGKRSLLPSGSCAYRGEKGTMCAVGCLIKDNIYTPDIEEKTIFSGSTLSMLDLSLGGRLSTHTLYVLNTLQMIHDNGPPSSWLSILNEFKEKLIERGLWEKGIFEN